MKTRTFHTAVCLGLLLSGSLSAHAQAPKTPTAPGTDAAVTAAQANLRLVQVRFQNGVGTPADVSDAKIGLSLARIRAALTENKTDMIPVDLAVIQAQRQDLLKLTQADTQVGIDNTTDLTQAQTALAEAQLSADLFTLWTLRHQALLQTQARMQAGLVSINDVDKAAAVAQAMLTRFTDSLPPTSAPASKP